MDCYCSAILAMTRFTPFPVYACSCGRTPRKSLSAAALHGHACSDCSGAYLAASNTPPSGYQRSEVRCSTQTVIRSSKAVRRAPSGGPIRQNRFRSTTGPFCFCWRQFKPSRVVRCPTVRWMWNRLGTSMKACSNAPSSGSTT